MPAVYDQIISRVDAAGLIPEPAALDIQQAIPNFSIALSLMRQVPMGTAQAKMRVLDSLPQAYWVNGDTGLKQTTKVSWDGKLLTAEELAVIVPIPEAVIADANVDIWAQVKPLVAQALGGKLDDATVFGIDRPASFGQAVVPATRDVVPVQAFADDPLDGVGLALSSLEGLDVNVGTIVARTGLRAAIRTAQNAYASSTPFAPAPNEIYGYPLLYPPSGSWPAEVTAIVGDWNAAIIGVRQDLTYRFLSESVISDDAGKVIFNLAQQDSVALRVVARYAFAIADQLSAGPDGTVIKSLPFATALTTGTVI